MGQQLFVCFVLKEHELSVGGSQRGEAGETHQRQRQQREQNDLHIGHGDLLRQRVHLLRGEDAHQIGFPTGHILQATVYKALSDLHIGIKKEEVIAFRLQRQAVAAVALTAPPCGQPPGADEPYAPIFFGKSGDDCSAVVGGVIVVEDDLQEPVGQGGEIAQQATDILLLIADRYQHRDRLVTW